MRIAVPIAGADGRPVAAASFAVVRDVSLLGGHMLWLAVLGTTVLLAIVLVIIYAVEWGQRGGELFTFLLISIPARWIRFALSALLSSAITRLLKPLTGHRAGVEFLILAVIWIVFYTFYFMRFGR